MKSENSNKHLSEAVQKMIAENNPEGAIAALSEILNDDGNNADLLFERGKLLWKLGRKTDAMSDYAAAVSIDPSSPAAAALEMARDVMAFYHRDLYNP